MCLRARAGGATAVVYAATDAHTGQQVALKVMNCASHGASQVLTLCSTPFLPHPAARSITVRVCVGVQAHVRVR